MLDPGLLFYNVMGNEPPITHQGSPTEKLAKVQNGKEHGAAEQVPKLGDLLSGESYSW